MRCALIFWFLHCSRPDVDWSDLSEFFRQQDYKYFRLNEVPIRYRRVFSNFERQEIERLVFDMGVVPKTVFDKDYMCVNIMVAIPRKTLSENVRNSLISSCADLA